MLRDHLCLAIDDNQENFDVIFCQSIRSFQFLSNRIEYFRDKHYDDPDPIRLEKDPASYIGYLNKDDTMYRFYNAIEDGTFTFNKPIGVGKFSNINDNVMMDLSGALRIRGEKGIVMDDVTNANILVANNGSFNSKKMTGDIIINENGVTKIVDEISKRENNVKLNILPLIIKLNSLASNFNKLAIILEKMFCSLELIDLDGLQE